MYEWGSAYSAITYTIEATCDVRAATTFVLANSCQFTVVDPLVKIPSDLQRFQTESLVVPSWSWWMHDSTQMTITLDKVSEQEKKDGVKSANRSRSNVVIRGISSLLCLHGSSSVKSYILHLLPSIPDIHFQHLLASLSCFKPAYSLGEELSLSATVNNMSRYHIRLLRIRLLRRVTLRAKDGSKGKQETVCVAHADQAIDVNPKDSKDINNVHLVIPGRCLEREKDWLS